MFLFFCSRQVIAHTQLIVIINILIVSENAIRTQADEIRLSADALIVFVNDNKSLDKTNETFYSDTYRVDITISNFQFPNLIVADYTVVQLFMTME